MTVAVKSEVLNSLLSGVAGGDLGKDEMLNRLQERFFWPGYTEDVHVNSVHNVHRGKLLLP